MEIDRFIHIIKMLLNFRLIMILSFIGMPIVVLIVYGYLYFFPMNQSDINLSNNTTGSTTHVAAQKEKSSSQATASAQSGETNQSAAGATETKGAYVGYTAEAVAQAKGKRLLFFHAPWCSQCRRLNASIEAGTIPDNVVIFKVDYDSNQKLRQQYGVTLQTTVVLLDESGNESKKYVAYDQPSLEAVIENLL